MRNITLKKQVSYEFGANKLNSPGLKRGIKTNENKDLQKPLLLRLQTTEAIGNITPENN